MQISTGKAGKEENALPRALQALLGQALVDFHCLFSLTLLFAFPAGIRSPVWISPAQAGTDLSRSFLSPGIIKTPTNAECAENHSAPLFCIKPDPVNEKTGKQEQSWGWFLYTLFSLALPHCLGWAKHLITDSFAFWAP